MHDQSLSQDQGAAVHIERGVPFGEVGGRVLSMDIARPAAQWTDVLSAVIDIHGSGWVEGERGVSTDSILPNNGFFFCSIDYRLSGETPFPAQIHDCKAAVRWLHANAARLRIDPDRICVGQFGGAHNDQADLVRLADPLTHVRPGAPPFLIVHGDRDSVSSAWHAVRLHDALRAVGADSTLWVYGGYGHDLAARWDECRQLLLRFFQHHLAAPR